MAARLNHTIVWCHDKARSSAFMSEMLGLPAPKSWSHFMVVEAANGVSLDFAEKQGDIARQHYAFLVDEAEFDAVMERIESRSLAYWADPARSRPGEINHYFGGRGVYFEDPGGHLLEAITRPYGEEADL